MKPPTYSVHRSIPWQGYAAMLAWLSISAGQLPAQSPPFTFTTFAGSPAFSGSTDGLGSEARFWGPTGVAVDASKNLYVADYYNHTIRKITAGGIVTTFAGLAGISGTAD